MSDVTLTIRTCYLAGPMRGHAEFNFPEFHRQAKWLRSNGWTVFSPAERDEQDVALNGDWAIGKQRGLDYFMQFDLAAVAQADCVILMQGWEESQGARLEAMVAVEISHPVFEIKRWKIGRGQQLLSVDNARIATEFIAGTRAFAVDSVLVTS